MKRSNILLISLMLVFVMITIFVCTGCTKKIDNYIYNFLISFNSENLTDFFKMVTRFSNVNFCIMLVLIVLIIFRNKEAIFLIITVIDIEIINLIIKFIIKRDRPDILKLISVGNYSYPSGHAMMSMGIYGYFIYFIYKRCSNKILKYILISILALLILLIGISRIYLGVHYFTDVFAGYILSLIYLILFIKIVNVRGIFDV